MTAPTVHQRQQCHRQEASGVAEVPKRGLAIPTSPAFHSEQMSASRVLGSCNGVTNTRANMEATTATIAAVRFRGNQPPSR